MPLRVLLFENSIAIGGMEEHVRLIGTHLPRDRFEVFCVLPEWPAIDPLVGPMTAAVDHLARFTPDRRHGVRRELVEAFRLARWVRRSKIDVAHFHSTTFSGQTLAAVAVRLGGVKHIYVTEHLAPDAALSSRRRVVRNLFTRFVSGVVCVSQKNYEARRQWLSTPPAKTVVVANGVDVSRFDPVDPAVVAELRQRFTLGDGPVIGTAVRFEPEKGLDDLVNAFAKVVSAYPDATLLMVGDGSLRADLQAQGERLGVGERIRFTGFQSDPRPFLAAMDVFVLPVPVGSMSIGLLEAMAMCLAVVMTFGGEGEAVVHGQTGLCAEPHDPDSIATNVLSLLDDPERRRGLGAAARAHVENHFSAARVATTLGTLYEDGIGAVEHPG